MLAWGPRQLDWPVVAKGYILLIASSHLGDCSPSNQNSKVLIHSVACRTSSPDLMWKNRKARATGREQRGTPRQGTSSVPLLSASRGARAAGGFGGLANRVAGGSAPSLGAMWQSPARLLPEG